jgi:DNA-binding NarL/FixJ family response regulator
MPASPARPRIVIADDYVLIQESLRLSLEKDCEIVAAVESGEAALAAVAKHNPDILLLDVSLSGSGGFQVAEELARTGSPVKIVFVTNYHDAAYIARAFEIGAKGYVLKGAAHLELPAAIREVAAGGIYRSSRLK